MTNGYNDDWMNGNQISMPRLDAGGGGFGFLGVPQQVPSLQSMMGSTEAPFGKTYRWEGRDYTVPPPPGSEWSRRDKESLENLYQQKYQRQYGQESPPTLEELTRRGLGLEDPRGYFSSQISDLPISQQSALQGRYNQIRGEFLGNAYRALSEGREQPYWSDVASGLDFGGILAGMPPGERYGTSSSRRYTPATQYNFLD